MKKDTNPIKKIIKIGGSGILFILLLIFAFGAFFTVGAGEAGVVFDRGSGVLNKTYDEGLHLKTPYWQSSEVFTTRTQKHTQKTSAASNDLQEVRTTITLNYHLSKSEVHDIYKNIGPDYKNRIIIPAIEESLKAVTARYDAQQLIQNRSAVKEDIDEMITKRLERNYITVDEVSIENFKFTQEFAQAIEEKEIARQKALEEKNRKQAVKERAEQRRIKAKGRADAIKTVQEQLADSPEYVEWFTIDKWNGKTQTIVPYVKGNGAKPLMNLPTATNSSHNG